MDWNSSALWGIIGLIGGVIVSFVFYKISNKSKKIIYTKSSQILITDTLSNISDLYITYQNQPIKNLTSTTITIKSTGKDIIQINDFGAATPFCIKTTGQFFLPNDINSIITKNSNLDNLLKPILKDDTTILLDFDYLSQFDEITFVILHTETIDIKGKLKIGNIMSSSISKKINNIMDAILYISSGIILFFISILYIFYNKADGTFITIGNFLINLLIGFILINYSKKIFEKFNNIEITIKDSDNSNVFYNNK